MFRSGFDLLDMVGTRGFEPPTPASRTLCSTRLSHVPTNVNQYVRDHCLNVNAKTDLFSTPAQ